MHRAMSLSIVILAAGQGTRMRSGLPKVLHPIGGTPLLGHVLRTARALNPARIIIVHGHGGETVRAAIAGDDLLWVEQQPQLGTGHAVMQALPHITSDSRVLVLYGDVPLLRPDSLSALLERLEDHGLALLTTHLPEPRGYGRILRDDAGRILRIVEEKDATELERKIKEVNTGILAAGAADLATWLARVGTGNAQGEYYLTDCVALAVEDGKAVGAIACHDPNEVAGVNDKLQLAQLERVYQRARARELMTSGVTVMDPERLDVRGEVSVGRDVMLDVNVVLEGRVELADGVRIGPHSVVRDCRIGPGSEVLAHSVLEEADIGPDCRIGPFARIRPGTVLHGAAHVGNFVEIKKSEVGLGSKINHLSYVGDSRVGARVNVGAGTITCNYDGANKHVTVIGDDAFIGSNAALVAPVEIGAGATIGAGSVITREAPPDTLTLTRARQTTVPGWKRPTKTPKT